MVSGARQSGQRQWSPASNRAAGMDDAARSCEQHTFCRPGGLPGAIPRRTTQEAALASENITGCEATGHVAGAGAGAGGCQEVRGLGLRLRRRSDSGRWEARMACRGGVESS